MEMRYQVVTVHWPLDALICAANNVWGEMALLPNTDSTALILPRLTDLTLISSVFLCHKCVRYYYTTNKIYFLNAIGCFQKPCLLFRKYKSQVDIAFFLVAVLVCLIRINENSCLLYTDMFSTTQR